jgi:predicted nucleic acid-binding protein
MIVLDASVVLKWILGDEEKGEKAKLYRDSHVSGEEIVAVHDLFFYEIANVLTTKTKLSTGDIVEAFSLIWNFDFDIFNFGLEEFLAGITLSRRYRITLYDAAYISLAKRLKCPFVTADKRLYERIKELKEIRLL